MGRLLPPRVVDVEIRAQATCRSIEATRYARIVADTRVTSRKDERNTCSRSVLSASYGFFFHWRTLHSEFGKLVTLSQLV